MLLRLRLHQAPVAQGLLEALVKHCCGVLAKAFVRADLRLRLPHMPR